MGIQHLTAGDPADDIAAALEADGAVIVEGYGLSEASPVTHAGPLDGTAIPGTIGLPISDTDARIVDAEDGSRQREERVVAEADEPGLDRGVTQRSVRRAQQLDSFDGAVVGHELLGSGQHVGRGRG